MWEEFERIFKKKYLSETYYDGNYKEFYELRMGSIIFEEYTTRFREMLRYVPYLKDEKENIQRFISGFLLSLKDQIEFDEPQSLEEAINNLEHCYEQYKCKPEFKCDWKGSEKTKGKFHGKKGRYWDAGDKESVAPHKKFNAPKK